jgi:hypothetical protein
MIFLKFQGSGTPIGTDEHRNGGKMGEPRKGATDLVVVSYL